MAINTIAGQDVGSRIRFRLSDTPPIRYQDSELNSHLSWAVDEYSNFRPYTGFYSFNTVGGLQSYLLPTGILDVTYSNYSNLGDITLTDTDQLDWNYLTGQIRDDDMRFLRDEFRGRWNDAVSGQVTVINQSWIYLAPIPDSITSVSLQYEAQHVITGTDYQTIPVSDKELIIDLVIMMCWEIDADEMMRQGDYRAGQTEVLRRTADLNNRAGKLRDQVYRRIQAGPMMVHA